MSSASSCGEFSRSGAVLLKRAEQIRGDTEGALRIAARQVDLQLHQLRRQIIRIISFEIAGKRAGLIHVSEVVIRLGHEVQTGARVWLLAQNFFQILDGRFNRFGLLLLHLHPRAQQKRLPIVLVFLQHFVDLVRSALRVALVGQKDFSQAITALEKVRRLRQYVLVDPDRIVYAIDRRIEVRQDHLAFRFVLIESGECFEFVLGFVELAVDEIETREHKTRVAIGWTNFNRLAVTLLRLPPTRFCWTRNLPYSEWASAELALIEIAFLYSSSALLFSLVTM